MVVGVGESGKQCELIEVRYGLAELLPVLAPRNRSVEGIALASQLVQLRELHPHARLGGQILIVVMIEREAQEQDDALYGGGVGAALREQGSLFCRRAIDDKFVAIRHVQRQSACRFREGAVLLHGAHATTGVCRAQCVQEPHIGAGVELQKLESDRRLDLGRIQQRQLTVQVAQHRPGIGVG